MTRILIFLVLLNPVVGHAAWDCGFFGFFGVKSEAPRRKTEAETEERAIAREISRAQARALRALRARRGSYPFVEMRPRTEREIYLDPNSYHDFSSYVLFVEAYYNKYVVPFCTKQNGIAPPAEVQNRYLEIAAREFGQPSKATNHIVPSMVDANGMLSERDMADIISQIVGSPEIVAGWYRSHR